MAGDPKSKSDTFKQIQEAFQAAQSQLSQLRKQVERHEDYARAKSKADLLEQQKEKALRELGEAVWRQVQKGKLELPASLAKQVKAMEHVEQQAEAHSREITDLLREGEEAARRLTEKNDAPEHSGVASRTKKL